MRWWRQADRGNRGLTVTSNRPFFASATNYTIESLDDGDSKHQRHFPEVDPVDYTILRIDGEHAGVGGVDRPGRTAASLSRSTAYPTATIR